MLWRTAAASGLAAFFKVTESPASAQGRGGAAGQAPPPGGPGGGGRGGPSVQYGPINKLSAPSDLRITDMRIVTVASNFDYTIVRLDTNQGIYGLGEIRDGAAPETVLNFKNQVVGRNPMDITGILQSIRRNAGHGRTGGAGYSAIDICLHDIVGKVFGVPIWRLLGDKKRDRVRIYCDTYGVSNPKQYGENMLKRKKMGFTAFKADITITFVSDDGKTARCRQCVGRHERQGLGLRVRNAPGHP